MIFAVVPAAGHSTRMGRAKLSLSVGDRTVLERVVAALRDGGAEKVVVVLGPHVGDLAELAEAAGADVCRLFEITYEMRSTVEHGLGWLEERYRPGPGDSFLLAPADHPLLDANVVRELCDARCRDRSKAIVVPAHAGRRGHPVLIGWQHVAGIRSLPPERGINAYLRDHEQAILEIDVESANVLRDLDTPDDYARLLQNFEWPASSGN
jgi:molybdenum cofactor cytidylyltransferase